MAHQPILSSPAAIPPVQVLALGKAAATETPWDAHEAGQLYALQSGAIAVETELGAMLMTPGRLGWIPPGHRHRAKCPGEARGWVAYLEPGLCGPLGRSPSVLQRSDLVEVIIARLADDQPVRAAAERDRLTAVLLDELKRAAPDKLVLSFPTDRRLAAITSSLILEPGRDDRIEQWARWAGLSVRSLTRGFRLETGLTFRQWRRSARMIRACEHLSLGTAIGPLALDLGYQSPSAFIAAFKLHFGITPAVYCRGMAGRR